jgi:hypothetical protein
LVQRGVGKLQKRRFSLDTLILQCNAPQAQGDADDLVRFGYRYVGDCATNPLSHLGEVIARGGGQYGKEFLTAVSQENISLSKGRSRG